MPRSAAAFVATTLAAGLAVLTAAQGQTSAPGLVLDYTLPANSQTAGNYTSTEQVNLIPSPAVLRCVGNQLAHSGSPVLNFRIDARDEVNAVTPTYYSIITSGPITNDNTPSALYVGPGITSTGSIGSVLPVPRAWRVVATVGGTNTPISQFGIHCALQ